MAPNLPQSSPPGQWSQPGPAMWQPPSSTTPLGTQEVRPLQVPQHSKDALLWPVTFPPAAPLGTTHLQAPGPTMPSTSLGNALSGLDLGPVGLMGPQHNTLHGLPPQTVEHPSVLHSGPPTSSTEIDFKALGDRLDAAFTEKLETIAQTLQASWQTAMRSSPFEPIGSANSSASSGPTPISSTPGTSSTLDQHQQDDPWLLLLPNFQLRQSLLCLQS